MTFTEIFEAIAEATGIEYSHFSVLGRIWDLADYYGVERRGKLVSQVLRELPQLVNRSPESNLISDLLNLTMRYSKYLSLTGAYSQETTTGAQKLDLSNVTDRADTTHVLTDTGLTVTGLWYVECYVDVTPNTDMYLSYAKTGSGSNRVAIFNEEGTSDENRIVDFSTTGGTFNTGDNNQVRVLFYSGFGTSKTTTYNDVMLCEGTSAKPYEPYTGGAPSPNPDYAQEMQAVEISELHSSGKNLFDRITAQENKILAWKTGNYANENNSLASDFIPVRVGETYHVNYNCQLCLFDSDKTKINFVNGNGNVVNADFVTTFTIYDEQAKFIKLGFRTGQNSYLNMNDVDDIMLNVGDTAEPYTPYTGADTVTLDEPLILRALPNGVADSYENGVITRRVGVVEFDGSADENWDWQLSSSALRNMYINIPSALNQNRLILCDRLISEYTNSSQQVNGSCYVTVNRNLSCFFTEGQFDSVADFKTWLKSNPITVWYELAEPTTEALDIDLEWYGMENFWTDSELDPNMTWKGVSTGVD